MINDYLSSMAAGDEIKRTKSQIRQKHIDGLEQDRRNSIANALELRLFRINPSIYSCEEHTRLPGKPERDPTNVIKLSVYPDVWH